MRSGGGGGGTAEFSTFILLSYAELKLDVVVVAVDTEELAMDIWEISRASDDMGCSVCKCLSSANEADFCDFEGDDGAVLEPSYRLFFNIDLGCIVLLPVTIVVVVVTAGGGFTGIGGGCMGSAAELRAEDIGDVSLELLLPL